MLAVASVLALLAAGSRAARPAAALDGHPSVLQVSPSEHALSRFLRDVDIGAMVAEPRCYASLPLVVWNMRTALPHLPIQIFHSPHNRDCVLGWFAGAKDVTLTELSESHWLGHDGSVQSTLFTTTAFWDLVKHEKVLTFQADSWVCGDAERKLERFLRYDYIGAPWDKHAWNEPGAIERCNGVGNGGFSIRTVKAMRDIVEKVGRAYSWGGSLQPEDVYFCTHVAGWKSLTLANSSEAGLFSAEEYDGSSSDSAPLGAHRPWGFPWFPGHGADAFRRDCPGILRGRDGVLTSKRFVSDCPAALKAGKILVARAKFERRKLQMYESVDSSQGQGDLFAVSFE